jgi:hypothetical protein
MTSYTSCSSVSGHSLSYIVDKVTGDTMTVPVTPLHIDPIRTQSATLLFRKGVKATILCAIGHRARMTPSPLLGTTQ